MAVEPPDTIRDTRAVRLYIAAAEGMGTRTVPRPVLPGTRPGSGSPRICRRRVSTDSSHRICRTFVGARTIASEPIV
jgi:hypothetical protein